MTPPYLATLEGLFAQASLGTELQRAIAGTRVIRCQNDPSILTIECRDDCHLILINRCYDRLIIDGYVLNSGLKRIVLTSPSGGRAEILVNPMFRTLEKMSGLQLLTREEVLAFFRQHEELTGLPANLLDMASSRPYLSSTSIQVSTGLDLNQMRKVESVEPFFPVDQLDLLKRSLVEANGSLVQINYNAAKLNQYGVYYERQVEGRLIYLEGFGDEVFRLMAHTAEPRRMN